MDHLNYWELIHDTKKDQENQQLATSIHSNSRYLKIILKIFQMRVDNNNFLSKLILELTEYNTYSDCKTMWKTKLV